MTLIKHIPALQVLIPFFAALFAALTFHKYISWMIASLAVAINLVIGIYALDNLSDTVFYSFGNWRAPIGIEYRLDSLSQNLIIYLNAVLLFFLIFGKQLINETITKYIDSKKNHLFYCLLLFAHSGYLGVVSSNDLFNIYVFIEISSLATYVLMSQGSNPRALIGAFDYLVMGTIGATLILISIGFFFALTGSLNISDISKVLANSESSKTLLVAIVFFLSGVILKMAFFPLHFWMIRAYMWVSPIVLTYLAAISSMLGVYMLMRFIYFTIEPELIYAPVLLLLKFLAIITILICSYLALKAKDIKTIIIYSSVVQVGYIFMLLSIQIAKDLLIQLLVLDSINKIALFTIISHIQNKTDDLTLDGLKQISNSTLFKILAGFIILFSANLPITSMFFVKVKMLDLLAKQDLLLEFATVIIGSICALLYHIKLAKPIYFAKEENGQIQIRTNMLGLIFIVLLQFLTLFYIFNIKI